MEPSTSTGVYFTTTTTLRRRSGMKSSTPWSLRRYCTGPIHGLQVIFALCANLKLPSYVCIDACWKSNQTPTSWIRRSLHHSLCLLLRRSCGDPDCDIFLCFSVALSQIFGIYYVLTDNGFRSLRMTWSGCGSNWDGLQHWRIPANIRTNGLIWSAITLPTGKNWSTEPVFMRLCRSRSSTFLPPLFSACAIDYMSIVMIGWAACNGKHQTKSRWKSKHFMDAWVADWDARTKRVRQLICSEFTDNSR